MPPLNCGVRRQPMRYEPIEPISLAAAESALSGEHPERLGHAVIAVGLHSADLGSAVRFLLRAAAHANPIVRGNVLISFGHLARRFGELNERSVKPLIDSGLADADAYVRSHAHSAADDLEHFLGWRFPTIQ